MLVQNNSAAPVNLYLRDGQRYHIGVGRQITLPDSYTALLDDNASTIALFNSGVLTALTDAGAPFPNFPSSVSAVDSRAGRTFALNGLYDANGNPALSGPGAEAVQAVVLSPNLVPSYAAQNPNVGYVTDLNPPVVSTDSATYDALAPQLFNGMPAFSSSGTRQFVAHFRNQLYATTNYPEAVGQYLVIKYSDDEWATQSNLSFILPPSLTAGRVTDCYMQQMPDQSLWVIFAASANGAVPPAAQGFDGYEGVWVARYTNINGTPTFAGLKWLCEGIPAKPKFINGEWLMPSTYWPSTVHSTPLAGRQGIHINKIDWRQVAVQRVATGIVTSGDTYYEPDIERLPSGNVWLIYRMNTVNGAYGCLLSPDARTRLTSPAALAVSVAAARCSITRMNDGTVCFIGCAGAVNATRQNMTVWTTTDGQNFTLKSNVDNRVGVSYPAAENVNGKLVFAYDRLRGLAAQPREILIASLINPTGTAVVRSAWVTDPATNDSAPSRAVQAAPLSGSTVDPFAALMVVTPTGGSTFAAGCIEVRKTIDASVIDRFVVQAGSDSRTVTGINGGTAIIDPTINGATGTAVTIRPPATGWPVSSRIDISVDACALENGLSNYTTPLLAEFNVSSASGGYEAILNRIATGSAIVATDMNAMTQGNTARTAVTASGQLAGVVFDKGGRRNHAFAPATGNRPTYSVASGKGYLGFDGTAGAMRLARSADFTDARNISFGLGIYANRVTDEVLFSIRNTATGAVMAQVEVVSGQVTLRQVNDAGTVVTVNVGSIITTGTYHYLDCVIDNGAISISLDGGTAATGTAVSGAVTVDSATLGAYLAGSTVTKPFQGRIYGAVLVGGVITPAERTSLRAQLAALFA